MNSITVHKTLKWRFKNHHHIQIAEDKTIYNTKTGREKKITLNGGSVGLWLDKKFIVKADLNKHIEPIPYFYF